jgi:diguanylate cyclase (GGDEF)-like protein/PAS domain S-box-containing protein
MLRVVGRIAQDHDLGLVALAFLVCLLATTTCAHLVIPRRDGQEWPRAIRTETGVVSFSLGVWATHFISMIGFRPDVPLRFDLPFCTLSLVASLTLSAIAFRLMPRERGRRGTMVASGLVLAAGIGAMHFAGMHAMHLPGMIHYDHKATFVALCLAALCSIAAMALLARRASVWAAIVLAFAVTLAHFVAAGAMTLKLTGVMPVAPLSVPRADLAIAVGCAIALLLAVAVTAAVLDQHATGRLAAQARRFRALADATHEGLIFEQDGRIVDANRAIYHLAGTNAASLIGRSIADLIPGIELHHVERATPIEHDVRLADGQTIPVEILWRSGPDSGERVVAVRDISREKAAEGRIERMARFDPLTGLANRELLEQQLRRAIAIADRATTGVALLYVDLDRFESIHEALGNHGSGQILIQAAHRLTASVRETDTVARVGRDEFVIIQTLTERPTDAAALADRIVTEMALPFAVEDESIVVTASVGVALYPADGAGPHELIKNAALAVRQAKHDGRGRWRYFETGMDVLLRSKRSLEHDMRVALNDNQFSLNYQPFFDTTTLQMIGYEALLRWDHPQRGRISPADFIPIAEESGLIVPIGSWVLATACAEAASWDQNLIISVNLSPAQFLQPGVANTVADVLQQTGLPSKRLELEITEGTLIGDTQNALRILTSLKALGAKIAMDDFGTGYSSLSYLRKFPFDKIKIDRSFIGDVEADSEAGTIVQAIIAMSRSLRLDVTAEGVETKQQLSMLRTLGCNFVQGYLLGRPSSVPQIALQARTQRWHITDSAASRLATVLAAR